MSECPCGTSQDYSECCEPIIRGARAAETPELLMRARYTAHVKEEIDFILDTVDPSQQKKSDRDAVEAWSANSIWEGLHILGTDGGGAGDDAGMVEFIARYVENGHEQEHHEKAAFVRVDGKWYFDVRNTAVPKSEPVRVGPKPGRNDPCPCGSGKKYKKCCGAA